MTLTLTLTLTQVGENRTYTQCGTEEYADLPLTPLTLTPNTPNPNS